MISANDLKRKGWELTKMTYWKSVLAAFILTLLAGGSVGISQSNTDIDQETITNFQSIPPQDRAAIIGVIIAGLTSIFVISIIVQIFLYNPMKMGCLSFFKKNNLDPPAELSSLLDGFKDYIHVAVTLFLSDLFISLWMCLLIVPGIVKMYSYRMVPYLLQDRPELSATETITLSREMMNGNKLDVFLYDLSFIGWAILSAITCGLVGVFWLNPYKANADAALYLSVKEMYEQKQYSGEESATLG